MMKKLNGLKKLKKEVFLQPKTIPYHKITKSFYFLFNIKFHHFPKKKNFKTSPLQKNDTLQHLILELISFSSM